MLIVDTAPLASAFGPMRRDDGAVSFGVPMALPAE